MKLHDRRWPLRAAVTAAALLGAGITVLPAPAQAVDPVPAPVLKWEISQQFDDHLSTHTYTGGATEDANGVVSFPDGVGSYNAQNGTATVAYSGSVRGAFVNGGNEFYSVTFADPIVTVAGNGDGSVSAVVSSTVTGPPATSTSPSRVVVTTFTAGTADWVAGAPYGTLTRTPKWTGVLPPDSPEAVALGIGAGKPVDGGSWAPTLLGQLDPGVRAHFYASAANQVKKPPSAFTADAPAMTVVKKITAVSPANGLSVEVKGAGFRGVTNPGDAGIYVGIAEAGGLPDVSDPSGMAAFAAVEYVPTASIAGGAFTKSLTAPTNKLDPAKTYAIYTWQAHSHSTISQDTVTALPINFGQLTNAPTVTKKITAASPAGGLTVEVKGTSFVGATNPGDAGVYVGIAETGGLPADPAAFAVSDFVPSAAISSGAFTKSLTAPTNKLDPAKTYAIYTWQAHSHSNSSQDTVTALPINFGQLTSAPTVTKKLTSISPTTGLTVEVKGTSFVGATNPGDAGVYVGVAEAGGLPDVSDPAGMAAFLGADFVPTASITAGAFTKSLTIAADKFDSAKSYAIYTWQAHSHSSTSQDTVTALPITFSQLTTAPSVAVSIPSATPAAGVNVQVVGSSFVASTNPGDAGVYVGVAEAGGLPDVSSQEGQDVFVASDWIMPAQIVSGGFTKTLNLPTSKLDPTKTYAVYTWQAHSHSNTSQDTESAVPIDFADITGTPAMTVTGASSARYGTSPKYVVSVPGQTGPIEVKRNGVLVRTLTLASGKATFTVPATWAVGAHSLTFRFAGGPLLNAVTTSKALTISKAATRVGATVLRKATAKKAGRVAIAVAPVTGGPASVGKIVITLKKGKVTKKLTRTLVKGKVVFNLPKVPKGTWVLKATYQGSTVHLPVSRAWKVKVAKK
jgi:hypothetical protein